MANSELCRQAIVMKRITESRLLVFKFIIFLVARDD